MKSGDGFQLFEDRMTALQSVSTGGMKLDWSQILQLLSTLIPLVLSCLTMLTPATARRRLGNRALLAVNIRKNMHLKLVDAFKIADDVFTVAEDAKDEEIQQFITDCCQ